MKNPGLLVYGIVSQAVSLASFAYFALWVYRIGGGKTIDSGARGGPVAAFAVDTALLAVFCASHSLLARTSVKQWMRRFVPHPLERSTYCLLFGVLLFALCFAWRPLPEVLWRITSPPGVAAIVALFILFWVLHFGAIFWMGYGEFFGLRQAWLAARGEEYRPPAPLTRRGFAVSHLLLVVSLMLIPWATPTMSVGQLYFCVFLAIYDVVGAWLSSGDPGDVPAPVPDPV
jgi:protein-S-isoprenylcysteine O-methyltransferase Ste14